jgi:hypothetical protein
LDPQYRKTRLRRHDLNDGAANRRGRKGRQEGLGRFGARLNTGFKVVLIGEALTNC